MDIVLYTTQNRLREKTFLRDNGFPVTPFMPVTNRADLDNALAEFGGMGVLKTAGFGYDGKGQRIIHTPEQVNTVWQELGVAGQGDSKPSLILESLVQFSFEASVVAARGTDGEFAHFGLGSQ